ncbi:Hypothetical protein, putative [Bodo saltans]|uniref:WW domain-containing protein n=1 Tax=Bodo saltans TaxID=75058 RepID=A0A0S4JAE7_BODSA|nr:Hypothetical protein, putative [Bodo saltans]|eukprot:CUG87186.1 Hypothetical protein, putative [Bodo saltans]
MEPINIILCGEAVTEVDALIAAIIGKQVSAIPEDNLLEALRDPSTLPNLSPGVSIGETYGKPPTLRIPLARAKSFPHSSTLLHQLGDATGVDDIEVHMYHAKEPSLLMQTSIRPHVLVLCFVPAVPQTFEKLNATWVATVDRLYPRPPVVLCGTRGEAAASRTVEQLMNDQDILVVEEEDICDIALRARCLQYVEVSASLLVNTAALEDGILKAAFGEPEKRLVPETITDMRKACFRAAKLRQAAWSWKRHPKTNRLFYMNRVTKVKQYTRPLDYDGDEPDLTAEERINEQRKKLEEEEIRLEREREEADVEHVREELTDFSARMADKSARYNVVVSESNRLQHVLDRLRDQQQVNINDRQALERERDEIGHDQANFSKTSVDEDREWDAKMAIAKSKMFQLEAVAALRAEDLFASEITEALVSNSGIANAIRDVLKEEVETQRKGGEARSAFDACMKRIAVATIEFSGLDKPIEAAKSALRQCAEDTRQLKLSLQEKQTATAVVRKELSALEDDALSRHERANALRAYIAELDKEISVKRSAFNEALRHDVERQECHRLKLLREQLVRQVAVTAATVAHEDVALKKHHINLSFVRKEFERVSTALLELYRTQSTAASSFRDMLLENSAYSPIAAAGLQYGIEAIEREALDTSAGVQSPSASQANTKIHPGSRGAEMSATAFTKGRRLDAAGSAHARSLLSPDAKLMVGTLDAKLQAAKAADAAAKRATLAASKYSRMAETMSVQRIEIGEALEMCEEAIMRYDPSRIGDANGQASVEGAAMSTILKDAPPLKRLEALVKGELGGDDELLETLRETFTVEILRSVQQRHGDATSNSSGLLQSSTLTTQALWDHVGLHRNGGKSRGSSTLRDVRHEVDHATNKAARSAAEYDALAKRLADDMTPSATRDTPRVRNVGTEKSRQHRFAS